jgi:hypothetical protein
MARNQAWLSRPTRAKRAVYEQKRRQSDKLCRKKKRTATNKRLCKISEEFEENDLHKAFREVKLVKEGFKPSTELCKDSQGNITGKNAGIRQRWKEYFEELLGGNSNEDELFNNDLLELRENPQDGRRPHFGRGQRFFKKPEE